VSHPRVLVLHNRYRVQGGEERAVELHVGALARAGIQHALFERDSSAVTRTRAGFALVRGGEQEDDVTAAVRTLGASVVHCQKMLPLLGPRALAAARAAGAKVVLHLHNYRLFCNVFSGFRDGHPCFRCRGRNTLPGLVLNCRGDVRESAAYAIGLARHQPRVFDAVNRFVAPSRAARERLVWLGVPAGRISVLGHYVPDARFASASRAAEGAYALCAGRVTAEKGFDVAVAAAELSGVPLRIAGDGPAMPALRERVARTGAQVELLGRLDAAAMDETLAGAALIVAPSLLEETFGLAALEGMAAGVPVAAFGIGALPEVAGTGSCVPPGDAAALAERMRALWQDRDRRQAEGEQALERARELFTEERFMRELLELYESA
jgi:glycosyltransferase involved in cell wall biosynthesis